MPSKMKYEKYEHRSTQAQSLVEVALILPLLLVLIISTIEIGRLFFTKIVITNAAREGAYYYATHFIEDVNVGANTVTAAITESENSGISGISVTITEKNCCVLGSYSIGVNVGTTVDDLLILGFLGNVLSLTSTTSDFTLNSSVEMMVQP